MRKILPILLGLVGLTGGLGAGLLLRSEAAGPAEAGDHAAADDGHGGEAPAPDDGHAAAESGDPAPEPATGHGEDAAAEGDDHGGTSTLPDYVRLNNQFIVPVVEDGRVSATVVLSLSLEVPAGGTEAVYAREPRLRDAFLQVLFDHANAGGFRGVFTDGANLVVLRGALKEAARKVMGDEVTDVLISDLVRQDA